jgi:membrane-associated phospholipid phosphatase
MHFPADVLGGFLISFILILIIRATVYRLLRSLFGMRC